MKAQVYSDGTSQIDRPWNIGITENAIQLDSNHSTCPMSEAEVINGALYFSAQWYESLPANGQEPGLQNYDLRLVYDKKSDLLTLEAKVSGGWGALGEYERTD